MVTQHLVLPPGNKIRNHLVMIFDNELSNTKWKTTHQWMSTMEGLNIEDFFEMAEGQITTGHELNIHKKGARLDCRRYSFN